MVKIPLSGEYLGSHHSAHYNIDTTLERLKHVFKSICYQDILLILQFIVNNNVLIAILKTNNIGKEFSYFSYCG